jgi:hypothetical protein
VIIPKTGSGSRGYGNTTLLLLLHPIHGGSAIMHLTNFMGTTSVIEDTLGSCGLSSIDVSHDANITVSFQGSFHRHVVKLTILRIKLDYQ